LGRWFQRENGRVAEPTSVSPEQDASLLHRYELKVKTRRQETEGKRNEFGKRARR
jgi:hypothetical protein